MVKKVIDGCYSHLGELIDLSFKLWNAGNGRALGLQRGNA